jgi:hypothetical protein
MDPTSSLEKKLSVSMAVSIPSDVGIEPDRRFCCREITLRVVLLPSSGGTVPLRILLFIVRYSV